MTFDLQRANSLKRVSAWLLDAILLCIITTMMAWLLSAVLHYDSYVQQLDSRYAYYEETYGVCRDYTMDDVNAMTPEQRANLDAASKELSQDPVAIQAYQTIIYLVIAMVSLSLFLACVILEFIVPMLLGHGQTVGKKVFGLAVMQLNGVRVNGVCMFIRTVIGKFAIELIIPILMGLMLYFGSINTIGWLVVGVIVTAELFFIFSSPDRCPIHDKLANTITVDYASQKIFDTKEDLIAYQTKIAAEKAAEQDY